MGGNDGGITPGQRMERLEEHQEATDRNVDLHVTNIWKKLNEMEVEMARSQTKLALVIGILSFFASILAQVIMKGVH